MSAVLKGFISAGRQLSQIVSDEIANDRTTSEAELAARVEARVARVPGLRLMLALRQAYAESIRAQARREQKDQP